MLRDSLPVDCSAMHSQLLALRKLVQLLDPPMHAFMEAKSCLNYFFCYRWLLIHFKREFAFDEVTCRAACNALKCLPIWASMEKFVNVL